MKTIIFAALLLGIGGCKLADKEVERTKSQLARMSQNIGADEAINGVSRAYDENVKPAVSNAKDTAEIYAKAVPVIQSAQDAGAEAYEKVSDAGSTVVRETSYYFSRLPQSESELERMIDDYNQQFAAWLKSNFLSFHSPFQTDKLSHRSAVESHYKPRPRPKS